ncbi:MAG: HEAT repeat domain-containing protein [bacterium]|nr:HEAT repeat domain-containing protein [bacterium]
MGDLRALIERRLRARAYREILSDCGPGRRTVRLLRSLLYSPDDFLRWRTVTMFGWLAANQPAMIAPDVQRLIWSLNDEAGAIGRGAPETIGEIARHNLPLVREGIHIVAHYLEDRETCRPPKRNLEILIGALWAVGRAGGKHPLVVTEVSPTVASFTADPEPPVRGHAVWALGQIGLTNCQDAVEARVDDSGKLVLYEKEYLEETTVGAIASAVLSSLKAVPRKADDGSS